MSDLIWSVIRKNNAYKVGSRHDTATFSTEAGNLSGRHSIHSSGFTHAVAIDVAPLAKGKKYGAAIKVRANNGVENKPARQWTAYRTKGTDARQRIVAKRIAKQYGRDSTAAKLVQLRVSKVLRASYRKKVSRGTTRFQKRHLAKEKKN